MRALRRSGHPTPCPGRRRGDGYMYRMERVHWPVVVDRAREIVAEYDAGVT
ncbi:hypothetical protein [Embleya sp. NPDC005575]|uniref:hypothetical protein n=1 Tax=Embleya sp. NPDC005575 TaxID=3156892 RepID=UPI0033AB8E94